MATKDSTIEVAASNGYMFTNALQDDFLIRTFDPSQSIHLGVAPPGSTSVVDISNSNVTVNGNMFINRGVIATGDVTRTANCMIQLYGPGTLDPTTTSHYGFGVNPGVLRYNTPSGANHVFYTNTTELMRITSGGSVGIGTTSPSAPLHITASSSTSPNANGVYIFNPLNTANNNAILSCRTAGSAGGSPYVSLDINAVGGWTLLNDNSDNGNFKIKNGWDNSGTTCLSIDRSTTNIGMGTTTPIAKHHIVANGVWNNNGGNFHHMLITDTRNSTTNMAIGVDSSLSTGSVTNRLAYIQVDGSSTFQPLCLQPRGGHVGIGSTNPAYVLHITTSIAEQIVTYKGTSCTFAVFAMDPLNAGWNGAQSIVYATKSSSTNRSINAAGTINVNGNDYAEYMYKSSDFVIAKGDITGINSEGKLTNVFDEAVSFVVKSTDPSFVGGDTWGSNDIVGERPIEPHNDASNAEKQEYQQRFDEWYTRLEKMRQNVDRISFCGQVPVNVYGASVGDYIIPSRKDDGKITGLPVREDDLSFAQYRKAVGKVIRIMEDGRAYIIVKIL
jgi:hypothetical protein